ncbi:PAS domain S-box protein [Fredinandcohnia quinoae]|uniref:PAS domain S-box protein n=1 Tax=Fredinandcohnia quinoae TaxID=2918902 RepID=A0AAW5E3Z0_9BACI|nr:PAS domain S-box protein [Fredinandcohnia sp. SECRCQ15]MCH1627646.1 PAS domain S-box protein [Fredinandcohnia sp. SECRCQ15]
MMKMEEFINKIQMKEFTQIMKYVATAFNSLQDLIFIIAYKDEEFRYMFANQAGLTTLDINENIFGRTFDDILSNDKSEFLKHHYLRAARFNRVVSFEDEVKLPSGKTMISETILTPIIDNEDIYIIAVVRDISEKSKQFQELQRAKNVFEENSQRLTSILEHNEDAVFMFDTEGYFLDVNIEAEKMTGYKSGELVGTNFSELMSKKEYELVQRLFQKVHEGESVRFESYIYHKEGRKVFISVKNIPIIIEGKVKGIYGIAKDITTEKKVIEELNQVNSRLESFFKDSSDSICIMDENGIVQFINDAFTNIYGYSKDEVIGKEAPVVPDWLKNETKKIQTEVLNGKRINGIHVKRQRKSGELLDISVTYSPIYDEFGGIIGMSTIGRDVTKQKKIEKEMIQVKEELELVWNYSTEVIFMLGYDGSIIKVNPAFNEMFGWEMEEITGRNLSTIYLQSQAYQLEEFLTRLREDRETLNFETRRKRRDGMIIDVMASYRPIKKGNIIAVATYKEITEIKQVMKELKESEERYRRVLESSPEALVVLTEGIVRYINQAGLDLLKAKSSSQVIGRSALDFVHSSNRNQVIKRMSEAANQERNGDIVVHKYVSLTGDTIYAETTSAPIIEQGQASLVLMFRDVTTKRRAEKALRESEERFRIIAEHSMDIIKILNSKGKVIYVSPSIEGVLGYPVRNVIGKSYLEMIHPDDINKASKKFNTMLVTREYFEAELRRVHQDGHSVWLHSDFIPVIDSDGEIEKIVVISEDVTEKRRKENELAKMAFYDHLTGLPNRRLFEDRLKQAMFTTDRTGRLTALMVLDCDKFKQINDTLGHDIGDEVIKEFAVRVRSSLRKMDTLSRVGGDEFTIVLPELRSEEEIEEVSKRILKVTEEPIHIHGNELQITTSIGISFYPTHAKNIERLFKEADQNLYKSKDCGGNTFTY